MVENVVIGCNGEVGRAIYQFFSDRKESPIGIDLESEPFTEKANIMHVCIPYSDKFVEIVKNYKKAMNPSMTFIYSTVAVGTTKQIGEDCLHSPIEGRHPNLYAYFCRGTRLVGGPNHKGGEEYFQARGLKTVGFQKAETTELGKLLSTFRYGVNLMLADEMKNACIVAGLNYNETVLAYQSAYNALYKESGEEMFCQPMLLPPNGKIGGHCVVPNAAILHKCCGGPFAWLLKNYNEPKNNTVKGINK